jgi:hypothetical protein
MEKVNIPLYYCLPSCHPRELKDDQASCKIESHRYHAYYLGREVNVTYKHLMKQVAAHVAV